MQDTRHVLAKISDLRVGHKMWLVGIDVESLYTSIPHSYGIQSVETFLDVHYPQFGSQNEFLTELLEFALYNNFFQFSKQNYQQIRGTSMGAAWAPAYACLHLGLWEEEEVFNSPMYLGHVHTWLRYIEDVFMVWRGNLKDLRLFIDHLNQNKRNIHLTCTCDQIEISFLVLWITVEEGQLHTRTFRKETAANTLLRADRHHPHWLKNGSPIGQFLRIKRNCTKDDACKKEGTEMYQRFHE